MRYSNAKSIEDFVKRSIETFAGSEGYSPQGTHQRPDVEKPMEGTDVPTSIQPAQPFEQNPFITESADKPYEIQDPEILEAGKRASQQILLRTIYVDAKKGASIIPSNCPAKGRVDDYKKTPRGGPACAFEGDLCPYFANAMFKLDDYYKEIKCTVDEKVKE
jgi:hypothetical protein